MGFSWTRDRTHVPCIGRRILNHCATWEVLSCFVLAFCLFVLLNPKIILANKKCIQYNIHKVPKGTISIPQQPGSFLETTTIISFSCVLHKIFYACSSVCFVLFFWPCHVACGIFPDQGSNPHPLPWQVILNHCTIREVLTFWVYGVLSTGCRS